MRTYVLNIDIFLAENNTSLRKKKNNNIFTY